MPRELTPEEKAALARQQREEATLQMRPAQPLPARSPTPTGLVTENPNYEGLFPPPQQPQGPGPSQAGPRPPLRGKSMRRGGRPTRAQQPSTQDWASFWQERSDRLKPVYPAAETQPSPPTHETVYDWEEKVRQAEEALRTAQATAGQ